MVWYRALSLSLRYASIRRSGIILIPYKATFATNFVSFATSIAELAHREKSRTQSVNHPGYLMSREPKLALRKKLKKTFPIIAKDWWTMWTLRRLPHGIHMRSNHCRLSNFRLRVQVTWLVVTEVRSESFRPVTERHHYNARPIYASRYFVAHVIFFIVDCGIAPFFCATACLWSSDIILVPRLPWCQMFLLRPTLLS